MVDMKARLLPTSNRLSGRRQGRQREPWANEVRHHLNPPLIGFDDPAQAFRPAVRRTAVFPRHDRPGHGCTVHLEVEGPDGEAQAPDVVVPFVVHLGEALLGFEGGRARAFGPRSATEVFDDLIARSG